MKESSDNEGMRFDSSLLCNVCVNQPAVEEHVRHLCAKRTVKQEYQVAWLLRAITCIDLTSLCGDDCCSNIHRLCLKAVNPVRKDLLDALGLNSKDVHVGAVCVYPCKVAECQMVLNSVSSTIPIAAVATGFPSGQYHIETRLKEIDLAIKDGASEIDIVISRDLALCGQWTELYNEVLQMKKVCNNRAHLKAILATGELGSLSNVYKASMVCMMAGANFIKTSTGKENINAILPVGVVMARAIREYFRVTGFKVGFKPAGGIRTAKDALLWQMLMEEELGLPWLFPGLFRIGASGLLSDIERQIFHYASGCYASARTFSYV